MRDIIIEHKHNKRSKSHAVWKHYAGCPTHVVGKVLHLEEAEFNLMEQYMNETSSKMRERIRALEREVDELERKNSYLLDIIQWFGFENKRLAKLLNNLTFGYGDTPLNTLMNLF